MGEDRPGASQPMPLPPDEGPQFRDERAEQVLEAAIQAHGGRAAIEGRQTIYIKWKITNHDFPEPEAGTLTLWFKRPMKLRREISYATRKETSVFDGTKAWRDNGDGPKLLGPLTARMMERGILELDVPLMYTEGGLRYQSIAKDPKGRLTQKLSWTQYGYARDLMIDVATSRLAVIGEYDTPAGAISRMKVFDDFRPVQGMTVPFRQETYRNSRLYTETEVLEIRFNEPLDDSLFEFRGKPGEPSTATASPGRVKN